jgi:hypothetical protein
MYRINYTPNGKICYVTRDFAVDRKYAFSYYSAGVISIEPSIVSNC